MTVIFVPVTGFLGAGKTTTIGALSRRMTERGRRVAVVTNDQGDRLVDTVVARESADRVGEVTGGCFCCRFEDLLEVVSSLVGEYDVVLAEAVGSCTDLQATVVRPLQQLHSDRFQVAPLLTVLDPDRLAQLTTELQSGRSDDLAYLFERQLAEADVIVVNKSDIGDPVRRRGVIGALEQTYADATVLDVSARTGEGIDQVISALAGEPDPARSLAVDYDRYARAEADLAWLNLELVISAEPLDPYLWARKLLREMSRCARERRWVVGHVKVLVSGEGDGPTKLSLTAAGAEPSLDLAGGSLRAAHAWVNARVACEPEELDKALAAAVRSADAAAGSVSAVTGSPAAFRPGYPRPVHRIPAAFS
ncbi:MAG TPA: GTP-binding protein [Kribbella sp.]|nr:GTP-binding protein [Kribbella sp.]